MTQIEHSIDINGSADQVWEVVAALGDYHTWNPFLTKGEGTFSAGEKIQITIRPGTRSMSFSPTVLDVEHGRRIRWMGKLGIPGIFDGEHVLEIEDLGNERSRFTQRENFRGVLVPFMGSVLRDTGAGFQAMNQALKDRVEAAA